MAGRVINIRGVSTSHIVNYVYVGRRRNSNEHFGNPFTHLPKAAAPFKVATREEAVQNHRLWLYGEAFTDLAQEQRAWVLANIHTLKDKVLGCYCVPEACHAHNLLDYVEGDPTVPEETNTNKEEPVTNTEPNVINNFNGEYFFLSNFYYQDSTLRVRLHGYGTVEAFFQAMKEEDKAKRDRFKRMTPSQAKKAGRLKMSEEYKQRWDNGLAIDVMLHGVQRKFRAGTDLAAMLVATGDAWLEEGNYWHDQIWGNCTCDQHGDSPGTNQLGLILMWVREELVDPNVHDKCFKCSGGESVGIPKGHVATGHGVVENGKWTGGVGVCFQCQGTAVETIHDRIRTYYYWMHHEDTTELKSTENPF